MSNLALKRAAAFLTSHQDEDGYWRDYRMEPGQSEAWTTACVGFALVQTSGRGREVDKATRVLLATRWPGGWGYNSQTACDADTTSWVIRFLAAMNALDGFDPESLLSPYITPSGRVHTFLSSDRFGSWGREHDEVAPLVGIALLSSGAFGLAERVRQSVLRATSWQPFWWRCYSYVCSHSLKFLSLGGGIPDEIGKRESVALDCLAPSSSAFDLAHRLIAGTYLGKDSSWGNLLKAQGIDGGWPPSMELLVPGQRDSLSGEPQADNRRLMSTAMSMLALLKESPVSTIVDPVFQTIV